MANTLRWLVYQSEESAYPYWVFIETEPKKFIFLKAKDRWPGPGKNIFCLPVGEASENDLPVSDPVDSCPIVSQKKTGNRINLILNRLNRKRCWFIFVKKEYKKKPGQFYEQVFWITQSSSISERRGAYLPRSKTTGKYVVLIDKNERYAYSFPGFISKKVSLPCGDYALTKESNTIAVIERKTRDNFLHEISYFDVMKARLQEMEKHTHALVVFEANYDVITKANRFYTSSYLAKLVADLMVLYPSIQFVFSKGRKSAAVFANYFFRRLIDEK